MEIFLDDVKHICLDSTNHKYPFNACWLFELVRWQAQTVNICTGKYADGHVTVLGAVCLRYSWTDFVIEGNGSVDAISRCGNDVRGSGRRCPLLKRSKILVRNKSGLLFDVCSINRMRWVRDGSLALTLSACLAVCLTFTLMQTATKTE